jgi:hypothetical protein
MASVLLLSTCGTHLEDLFQLHLGNYYDYCLDISVQTNYAYFAGGKLQRELSAMTSTNKYSIQHLYRFLPHCSACTLDQAHQIGNKKQDRRRFFVLSECHVCQFQNLAHRV